MQPIVDDFLDSSGWMVPGLVSWVGAFFVPIIMSVAVRGWRPGWKSMIFIIFFIFNHLGFYIFRELFPPYRYGSIYVVALVVVLMIMCFTVMIERKRSTL